MLNAYEFETFVIYHLPNQTGESNPQPQRTQLRDVDDTMANLSRWEIAAKRR